MGMDFRADVAATAQDLFTPLHFCAQKGCLEGCRLLVQKKAKVNAKLSKNYRTPLHLAAAKGDVEVHVLSSCSLHLGLRCSISSLLVSTFCRFADFFCNMVQM